MLLSTCLSVSLLAPYHVTCCGQHRLAQVQLFEQHSELRMLYILLAQHITGTV